MALSSGYPSCETEGVKRYAWNSEQTCLMSCKKDVCLCVEPEITCIKPFSFVTVNDDGVAVQLTAELLAADPGCCKEIYFSVCCYKPREPGKQRYFYYDMTVNGNCICWDAMGFKDKAAISKLSLLALRNKIKVRWPHVN